MQKWDYLSIVVDYEGGNFLGRPRYVNGQEIPNWQQSPTIFEVVNYLGWKGWESIPQLNAFLGFPAKKSKQKTFIFRRLKE